MSVCKVSREAWLANNQEMVVQHLSNGDMRIVFAWNRVGTRFIAPINLSKCMIILIINLDELIDAINLVPTLLEIA